MRIVHLMLSSFYIDNASYQENCLPKQNKLDGHEVTIIASTEIFVSGKNITSFSAPSNYINEDDIPVFRLQDKKIIFQSLSKKIKTYYGLNNLLKKIKPEIIFFHGISSFDLITVSNYIALNPSVKLYVDCHSDFNNSAKTFISKYILHKLFYNRIIKYSYRYISQIFYITVESKNFLQKIYNLNETKLTYLPLGGFFVDEEIRLMKRRKLRSELNILNDTILLIHSGKMDENKRTFELLSAFNSIKTNRFKLLLLGSMDENISSICLPLIEANKNVVNVGWVSGIILQEYLYAGDLYLQLGSQSVSMQNALCSGCAAAVYPYESHLYLLGDKVFYIKDKNDIISLLSKILEDESILEFKRNESFEFAKTQLDYKVIANRYL